MKISTIILLILELLSNFVTEDCIKNNDSDYAIVWHYVSVIVMMSIFVSCI